MFIIVISIILACYIDFLRKSVFRGVLGNKKLVLGKMGNLGNKWFLVMHFSEKPIPLD